MVPAKWYTNINKTVMSVVFFIPLCIIAVFESQIHTGRAKRFREYLDGDILDQDEDPKTEDPDCEDEGEICRVSFDELTSVFPEYV